MIGVVVDSKVVLNQRGHPRGRPQVVGPAMGRSPGLEQDLQLKLLGFAQPRRRAPMGHRGQAVGLLGLGFPPIQRTPRHAQNAGNDRGRFVLVHQQHGMSAPAL